MDLRLLDFLKGDMFDIHGRMIEDIFNWDNYRLEHVHDYIQWVFPTKEESMFNMSAPLLNDELIEVIKKDRYALMNFDMMLQRMDDFYELWNYEVMNKWWVTYNNHNYLRITRILTCLNLVGMHEEMELTFERLTDTYEHGDNAKFIGDSYKYWKSAVEV